MKARRRAVVVTALVATAMLLPVSAAHAAVSVSVTGPGADLVVHSAAADGVVTARVNFDTRGECPDAGAVSVRLVTESGEPVAGTTSVALEPTQECPGLLNSRRHRDYAWTGAWSNLLPALAASCNGAHALRATVAAAGEPSSAPVRVVVSRVPNAPTSVTVTTQSRQATVSWQAPAHPDLTGFDVQQKRSSNGPWETVRAVGKGTTSVTLTNLDPGPIEFRVIAVRGDGFTADGDPAIPCSDTGRDLESAESSVVTATIPAASTSPSPSPSPNPTDGSTDPDDDDTDPADESTEPTDDATESEASPSPTPTTRPRSASRAAPPRVESEERRDVEAPEISQPERRERFFGDDEEFAEELDFGAGPPEDPDRERGTVSVPMPGAFQSFLGTERTLDLDLVLVPMAGGMILLSLGLHLRRWTRLGVE